MPKPSIPPRPGSWLPKKPDSVRSYHSEDDARSLASVPSLTSSDSISDSASNLSENSFHHTSYSMIDRTSSTTKVFPCLHLFTVLQAKYLQPYQEKFFVCGMCFSGPHLQIFKCGYCRIRLCRSCCDGLESHSYTVSPVSVVGGSKLPNIASRSARHRKRTVSISYSSQSPRRYDAYAETHNDNPAHHRDSSNSLSSAAETDQGTAVVDVYASFSVNVLITEHDHNQLVTAGECYGETSYVSTTLVRRLKLTSQPGQMRITWRRLGDVAFTHTYCEVVDKIQGKREIHLALGTGRQKPVWSEGVTTQEVIRSSRPRFLPTRLEQFDEFSIPKKQFGEYEDAFQSVVKPETSSPKHMIEPSYPTKPEYPSNNWDTIPVIRDLEELPKEISDTETSPASSSDESSGPTIGLADELKCQIIDRVVSAVTRQLRSRFIQAHKAADETKTEGSTSENTSPGLSGQEPAQNQANASGKRKVGESDYGEGEDGEDDDICKPSHPGTSDKKGKAKEVARFACPYFKYNPAKYQEWKICPGPGWLDVHRVKEHLYRRHRQAKFRCARCWECFEIEQSFIDHLRASEPCHLREKEPIEGFDAKQEEQLKSRKKKQGAVSEVEKWRSVFRILFPHVLEDDIPSAFYEYDQLSNTAGHAHDPLTECEEFMLREVPIRLREFLTPELDRDFHIIEQSLQRRAVEYTGTILATLFQEFRKRHQRDITLAATSGLNTSQGPAGPSSTQSQIPWLDSQDNDPTFDNLADFDFNFHHSTPGTLPPFEDVQLEDILFARKESDSGYESFNVEQPNENIED
ncbi:hypothetical protein F5Y19DRAFT_65602 [Xylariaceae sp. FL1651]|nr:hypothetical protein F5Y19DRAFT_65602 [Xylariaceae sp. FL1651]